MPLTFRQKRALGRVFGMVPHNDRDVVLLADRMARERDEAMQQRDAALLDVASTQDIIAALEQQVADLQAQLDARGGGR